MLGQMLGLYTRGHEHDDRSGRLEVRVKGLSGFAVTRGSRQAYFFARRLATESYS
jgi:hypothetical protein